jgi:hypothetical protein
LSGDRAHAPNDVYSGCFVEGLRGPVGDSAKMRVAAGAFRRVQLSQTAQDLVE